MIEVLLVDDEAYVTESLARTIPWPELGVSGVVCAQSAAEALRVLEERDIDIVVTDIRMPEMDGLALIAEISRKRPHVRTILLTGYSDFEYAKRAIQLQVFDYILKPVNDEELMLAVSNAVESIQDEWRQQHERRTDYPVLRANLLHDLLLGRRLSPRVVEDKLRQYEVPLRVGDDAAMVLVQLGRPFSRFDESGAALMEFAVGNIAEELLAPHFRVWYARGPHDYPVIVAALRDESARGIGVGPQFETGRRKFLEDAVRELRRQVRTCLNGDISAVVAAWFAFPDGLPAAYRESLAAMFRLGREEEGRILFLEDEASSRERPIGAIDALYRPPTLVHLLESNQWEAAKQKVFAVLDEAEAASFPRELLYEIFFSVTNALMYVAHRQGRFMSRIAPQSLDFMLDRGIAESPDKLRRWTADMMDRLREELAESDRDERRAVIRKVRKLVAERMGPELSVKTVADQVYMHPVYLSKVFKAETGESLGDYIFRMRMERAAHLLRDTNKKIYEISSELGYQNPQHFSKMFRKHYGVTPNEFREQAGG